MSRTAESEAPADVIDYDELYDRYLKSLVDTLRGFSSGIDGLEHYVPSEDLEVSLTHLLEAAAAEGRREISVLFGRQSAARLEPSTLERLIAPFGLGRVVVRGDGLMVEVKELRARATAPLSVGNPAPRSRARERPAAGIGSPPAPCEGSAAVYAAALERAARSIQHEGVLPEPAPPVVRVDGQWGAVRLALDIDSRSHTVLAASFAGVLTDPERALLDCLCGLLPGLPLLEAAQHGVIRLEHRLRDDSSRPPVPGVITPEAAQSMFALPRRLIRAALLVYRARTGYEVTDNRYDSPPALEWTSASPVERLARLAKVLEACRTGLGLQDRTLEIRAVEFDVRVVIALDPRLPGAQQRTALLAIERALQDRIDPRLEVYAEERKDRNKLRRLQVISEGT